LPAFLAAHRKALARPFNLALPVGDLFLPFADPSAVGAWFGRLLGDLLAMFRDQPFPLRDLLP
jgi:hypothetical protein